MNQPPLKIREREIKDDESINRFDFLWDGEWSLGKAAGVHLRFKPVYVSFNASCQAEPVGTRVVRNCQLYPSFSGRIFL
jgi:hypothetical protein